ncbi:hypothetical protein AVEN_107667-1, partial [Araneus ventricosus]
MVWREPRCHLTDCYFCMSSTVGFSRKISTQIQYPNIPSPVRPVPHNESLQSQLSQKPILYIWKRILKIFSHSLDPQRPPMMMK